MVGYISRQEAARRAGVHYNSIRDWERQGRIVTERRQRGTGYEVMVETSSLEKVIAEREETSNTLSDNERIAVLEERVRDLRERLTLSEEERQRMLAKLLDGNGNGK